MEKPYLLPKFKDLQKEYDAVVQCNRCGFCETVCPTYVVSGKENLSPRGRNQAFRQILEGANKDPQEATDIFSTCLTCHACTNVCFSQVPVATLMAHAKNVILTEKDSFGLQSVLLRFLLRHRWILSLLLWKLFLLKRMGISSLLKKSGLLRKLSPEIAAAEELVKDVPLRFGACARKIKKGAPLDKSGKECPPLAYFSGCGIHYLFPNVSRATVRVLNDRSSNVAFPNHACCGLIAQSQGDTQTARDLARTNIRQFARLGTRAIVVDDDSCCGFMKNYGELLNGDLSAIEFSSRVKNISEVVLEHGWSSDRDFKKRRATYHDPCQMGNAHHQTESPRKVLQKLRGIEFVELEESNWCCGGAGTYGLKHPHLSEEILERKLACIKASGAQMVVTQASSCL
ncbi:MAG: (Fe-S)-binding protein, partial [Elusimicrobia bacterium]|nr:(Fe-S)-binding protein [Elusimicrobiota bacterium]